MVLLVEIIWSQFKIRKLPPHRASLVHSKLIQTMGSYGKVTPNLSTEEKIAIKELKSNKDIVILKADKGNSTVIMNSEDYSAKISQLLDNDTTYKKLAKDPTKTTERKVAAYVRKLGRKLTRLLGLCFKIRMLLPPEYTDYQKYI